MYVIEIEWGKQDRQSEFVWRSRLARVLIVIELMKNLRSTRSWRHYVRRKLLPEWKARMSGWLFDSFGDDLVLLDEKRNVVLPIQVVEENTKRANRARAVRWTHKKCDALCSRLIRGVRFVPIHEAVASGLEPMNLRVRLPHGLSVPPDVPPGREGCRCLRRHEK
jgi:hypothetical protein